MTTADGNYYEFYADATSFAMALDFAANQPTYHGVSGHLLVLDSETEAAQVSSFIEANTANGNNGGYWLAASVVGSETKWQAGPETGSPLGKWPESQLRGSADGENCVAANAITDYADQKKANWSPVSCSAKYSVVVEYELAQPGYALVGLGSCRAAGPGGGTGYTVFKSASVCNRGTNSSLKNAADVVSFHPAPHGAARVCTYVVHGNC